MRLNPLIVLAKKGVSNNFLQFNSRIGFKNISLQYRAVTDHSWVVQQLKAQGETIDSTPADSFVSVSLEAINAPPSEKVTSLINRVLGLNCIEVQQYLKETQRRLGISEEQLLLLTLGSSGGVGGGAAPAAAAAAPEPVKEKEFFELKLSAVDAKAKIKVIKEVRTITGLGLKEAKELVEKAPVSLKDGLKKDEAEKLKAVLVEAGATIELV